MIKNIKILFALALLLSVAQLQGQELAKKYKGLPCINKTFQIHAHVILDSLGVANYTADDLRSAIVGTNEAFAPICASFELCSVDTITNYEFDSIPLSTPEADEAKNLFLLENRINIFLPTFSDPGVGGWATLCGVKQMRNGAIFLVSEGSGVLIHEMGHLFGLLHTFEGSGIELVDGSNCETEGDLICDTPADPFVNGEEMSQYIGENCEFISIKLDSMNAYYQPDVGNFMSYYPCACGFTRGQYIKMAEQFLISDPKMW